MQQRSWVETNRTVRGTWVQQRSCVEITRTMRGTGEQQRSFVETNRNSFVLRKYIFFLYKHRLPYATYMYSVVYINSAAINKGAIYPLGDRNIILYLWLSSGPCRSGSAVNYCLGINWMITHISNVVQIHALEYKYLQEMLFVESLCCLQQYAQHNCLEK